MYGGADAEAVNVVSYRWDGVEVFGGGTKIEGGD